MRIRRPKTAALAKSFAERFWRKVAKTDGCWEWIGSKKINRGGYGRVCSNGQMKSTHRVAWELTNGPIPNGLFVLHKCDNPPCCNPDHLFLGTNLDNSHDRAQKGRNSPRNGENTGSAKLTWELVARIRLDDRSCSKIAASYGVSRLTIHRVKKNEAWKL